jgi:hypothetical protein
MDQFPFTVSLAPQKQAIGAHSEDGYIRYYLTTDSPLNHTALRPGQNVKSTDAIDTEENGK